MNLSTFYVGLITEVENNLWRIDDIKTLAQFIEFLVVNVFHQFTVGRTGRFSFLYRGRLVILGGFH